MYCEEKEKNTKKNRKTNDENAINIFAALIEFHD